MLNLFRQAVNSLLTVRCLDNVSPSQIEAIVHALAADARLAWQLYEHLREAHGFDATTPSE